MKQRTALAAGSLLLFPATALGSPAQASTDSPSASITNCSKTKYGVPVRIKIRDLGDDRARIRVSHRFGTGNLLEPRVRSTRTTVRNEGDGANSVDATTSAPSFRANGVFGPGETTVTTVFRLRGDRTIRLSCTMR